jgi:serine/threonine-protein kinase
VRLGRYELLARLASGGMGEIFLARLEGAAGFEKLLVIKRILPHLADDTRFRAMLIAEARIASRMAHANICQVYELGETDGQLYIVMEHLEGLGLLPLLRRASRARTQLDLGFVGGVVQQCCDALHYAHELRDRDDELLGVVHRDVTPGNIFITGSGIAKLLDFGIAKVKDVSTNTQSGTVKGKHAYMAPEQLRGGAIDRRVDVFALGVVIFEMLALRRLFQRKTDYLTFRALMEQPIPDVRRYRPDAPAALAELLLGVLDRDPDRRPATARQLGASILDAIAGRPWSQSDICDFLRTSFADEINRRRAETSKAVEWSADPPSHTGVPALDFDAASDELDDDDDFPPVDTALADAPLEAPQAREPGGRPRPPLATGGGGERAPVSRVAHKRGVLWPLLALAMIGISAAAMFLVWKRMERQPPETIIVTESRSDAAPAQPAGSLGGPAPTGPDPAVPAPGGSAAAAPPRMRPATPPRPADPYNAVIGAHRPQMSKCMTDNPLPSGPAKMNLKVKVIVQPSGKPKAVSFDPGTLDDTAAGACIKRTLSAASFPSSKAELTVTFPIWL